MQSTVTPGEDATLFTLSYSTADEASMSYSYKIGNDDEAAVMLMTAVNEAATDKTWRGGYIVSITTYFWLRILINFRLTLLQSRFIKHVAQKAMML